MARSNSTRNISLLAAALAFAGVAGSAPANAHSKPAYQQDCRCNSWAHHNTRHVVVHKYVHLDAPLHHVVTTRADYYQEYFLKESYLAGSSVSYSSEQQYSADAYGGYDSDYANGEYYGNDEAYGAYSSSRRHSSHGSYSSGFSYQSGYGIERGETANLNRVQLQGGYDGGYKSDLDRIEESESDNLNRLQLGY